MGKIVVYENVTLDGVMQAPGRPDEDRRGAFEHGGWAVPYAAMGTGASGATNTSLLLGRRTYEDFYTVWPNRADNPFTEILNNTQKYVVSTMLEEPLPWINSTLLKGAVAETVGKLKKELEHNLVILGSGVLVQALMQHNLIDEYTLLIHPLVLGSGRHLFPDGGVPATLQLVDTETTSSGVIIASYRQA